MQIVFVSGNFSIPHSGHFRLLLFASKCDDFLVVGGYKTGPLDTLFAEQLKLKAYRAHKACKFVNEW